MLRTRLTPILPQRSAPRSIHTTSRLSATIGIRAEASHRIWERRAPLTPDAVHQLRTSIKGTRVLVQGSEKRVFSDDLYRKAGAEIVKELDGADIVLGIKEIPKEDLVPNTTYAFFSHTHKGQGYNLGLLECMLASGSRFIDWELLTDDDGVRSTAFGYMAGLAGMSDGLSLFGTKALAQQRAATPFLTLPRPFMMDSVEALMARLTEVGNEIKRFGTPPSLGPLTVAVLGKGRVSNGAKAVLNQLPTTWVTLEEMKKIVGSSEPNLKNIYACQVELSDYLSNLDGSPFDKATYYKSPELFHSEFNIKVAPWTTILLNGAFWKPGCPRILSTEQLANVKRSSSPSRMVSVIDVACDFGGGLEFVTSATTIDDPVIQFDPITFSTSRDASQPGTIQLTSIEILPSELPFDSSTKFSNDVLPYIRSLLEDPKSTSDHSISRGLRRATLVENGKLAATHTHLYDLLKYSTNAPGANKATKRKKTLVLGSGLVAAPAIKVLAARTDLDVVIASNDLKAAEALTKPYQNATAVALDVGNAERLKSLVADADVVLSLLPAPLHVEVAKLCIDHKTSLVTASYTSPAMRELSNAARDAGVILLNELGLDPGIDHISANALIEDARKAGNKITSFVSFCGGLPSPENSNGPLGYKFSWSPRGVLTAALNDATFRLNSRDFNIPGKNLLSQGFSDVPIIRGLRLEGVANRNSLDYLAEYGLPSDLPTIIRGTLRYPTFSTIVDAFKKIGLLDQASSIAVTSWQDLTDLCLKQATGLAPEDADSRKFMLADLINPKSEAELDLVIQSLQSLALIPGSSTSPTSLPLIPSSPSSPLDLLSIILAHQLRYLPEERDAVILHHELGTLTPDSKPELFTSTLIQYGVPGGDSAMATTVGVPIALGALLVLDGKVKARGVVSPSSPEVWKPLLKALQDNGVRMVERTTKGRGVVEHLERQLGV